MLNKEDEPGRATRNSWHKLKDLPALTATLSIERKFNDVEFRTICLGLIPDSMDDKWFIFFEEPKLYFHRSWTGQCIYEVEFAREKESFIASKVLANRDPEQYKISDNIYDQALLLFLIENLLLGNQTPFPVIAGPDNSYPAGTLQHNIAGTGYKEKKI